MKNNRSHSFRFFLLLIFISLRSVVSATTWDEPWHDRVVKDAESFVLAQINSCDEEKGVTVKILKTLAGTELKGEIEITDFSLLDLCSSSGGHGPEFHFSKDRKAYFFIRKNAKGKYCIATPTSGFAMVKDDKVIATYRHSYHQALVETTVYEKTMTAIFSHYHHQVYDTAYIHKYVQEQLAMAPSTTEQQAVFFGQHVALECVYHFRLSGYEKWLTPFLNDTSNFHAQVSAARAFATNRSPAGTEILISCLADTTRDTFVKVMCIWSLTEIKPVAAKETLTKLLATASTASNGFGGNIMDPRVCTRLPDVKEALEKLIAGL